MCCCSIETYGHCYGQPWTRIPSHRISHMRMRPVSPTSGMICVQTVLCGMEGRRTAEEHREVPLTQAQWDSINKRVDEAAVAALVHAGIWKGGCS